MLWLALCLFVSPAQAEDEIPWRQLHAPSADASSFLRSAWNKYTENYHPSYVLDGNPATAWVEGVDGDGEGEALSFRVSRIRAAKSVRIRVRNGYQKSEGLLTANAAPKDVVIRLVNGAGEIVATESATLERKMGWQEVSFPIPEEKGFESFVFEVRSVHPGSRYRDTCVSDIELFVNSQVEYNAQAETTKQSAVLAWIAGRQEAAAYFASQPADYPFAFTQYKSKSDDDADGSGWSSHSAIMAAAESEGPWYRVAVSRKLKAPPEGLSGLEAALQLFEPSNVAFFETDDAISKHTSEENDYSASEEWRSSYKVRWQSVDGAKVPEQVWFKVRRVDEERSTYTTETAYLVKYTPKGEVTAILVTGESGDFEGKNVWETTWTMQHDDEGHITLVNSKESTTWTWGEGMFAPGETPPPTVRHRTTEFRGVAD